MVRERGLKLGMILVNGEGKFSRRFELVTKCLRKQRLRPATFTTRSKFGEGSPALIFSVRIERWPLKRHGIGGTARKRTGVVNFGSWVGDYPPRRKHLDSGVEKGLVQGVSLTGSRSCRRLAAGRRQLPPRGRFDG